MGLFNSLFGKTNNDTKKEERSVPWIPLASLSQLEEIEKRSITKTQVIFKHSTTCGISSMVLNTFKRNYNYTKDQIDLYYLDLHGNRDVSNEIAYKFQVIHQSPQLLIIKNGMAIAHSSHGGLNELDLNKYI